MSGLDNMKSQILDEAKRTAEAKVTEAKAKATELLDKARAEAAAQVEKISAIAQADVAHLAERTQSSCDMQRKQALLRAKQDVIAAVLDKAYDRIMDMDDGAYFEMVRKMLKEYVLPENGEIYFSAKDLSRLPAGFEEEIGKIAAEKGGALSLSKETKEMKGGFILVYGGIEENCTVKALFDAKRDELSDTVNKSLFS